MDKPVFYRGVICPMITPLNEDLSLDVQAIQNLIPHIVSGRVHGIFILGTTGEASSLSHIQRKELIALSSEAIKESGCPLLVGIGDTSLAESLNLAAYAKEKGAQAVVATAPYYFDLDPEDQYDYFKTLADQTELPLYLYNYPKSTHFNIRLDVVEKLTLHPNIMGIKDSSGNVDYIQALHSIAEKTNFNLLIGPEELLLESLNQGIHGGVNGGANLLPQLYSELFQATQKNDTQKAAKLHTLVLQLSKGVYALEGGANSYLKGIKAAAAALGLCKNKLAVRLKAIEGELLNQIEVNIKTLVAEFNRLK